MTKDNVFAEVPNSKEQKNLFLVVLYNYPPSKTPSTAYTARFR